MSNSSPLPFSSVAEIHTLHVERPRILRLLDKLGKKEVPTEPAITVALQEVAQRLEVSIRFIDFRHIEIPRNLGPRLPSFLEAIMANGGHAFIVLERGARTPKNARNSGVPVIQGGKIIRA